MRKETLKLMSGAFIMAAVLCSGLYKTAYAYKIHIADSQNRRPEDLKVSPGVSQEGQHTAKKIMSDIEGFEPGKEIDGEIKAEIIFKLENVSNITGALFCPSNPNYILAGRTFVDMKNGDYVSFPDIRLRGWVGEYVLGQEIKSEKIRLIDPLDDGKELYEIDLGLSTGPASIEDNEQSRVLQLLLKLSKGDSSKIKEGKIELKSVERKASANSDQAYMLYDQEGNSVYKHTGNIYTLRVSPDGYKYYISDAKKYYIYNRMTNEIYCPPIQPQKCHQEVFGNCHASYYWAPDSSTLLVVVEASDHKTAFLGTELYIYSLVTNKLYKVKMPEEIEFIRIEDVSSDLKVILSSGHVVKLVFNN